MQLSADFPFTPIITNMNPNIENNFSYHAPQPGQPEKYQMIREKAKELAYLLDDLVPAGRERSISMTHLETVVFFANAGIARSDSTLL